jgi:hypothetical protein
MSLSDLHEMRDFANEPAVAAVSGTVARPPMPRRAQPAKALALPAGPPIWLRTCVTLIVLVPWPSCASANLGERLAAQRRHAARARASMVSASIVALTMLWGLFEPRHFGEHVLDARELHDRAYAAARR